jgi:hypothetical protein
MGDEMHVMRMYRPDDIVSAIQANLQEHHHEDTKTGSDMHIYLDGMKQGSHTHPYKNGFRYSPADPETDTKFVEHMRSRPGTIDLSGIPPKIEEKKFHSSQGGHHGH